MFHVGASAISLAPTYFISQSALILLLLLSKPDPFTLGSGLVFGAGLKDVLKTDRTLQKERHAGWRVFLFGFRHPQGGSTLLIKMLGTSGELPLRQGFRQRRKHFVRRKSVSPLCRAPRPGLSSKGVADSQ